MTLRAASDNQVSGTRTMARQCYASHKRNGRRVSSAASKPSSSALVRATSWVSCSGMPARTKLVLVRLNGASTVRIAGG